ncbi:MAG: HDIG domain-containing protein [Deltaproteobacteria bacterium]|nr:HDIG domain-containing protein [Deltaproteobacteria bacterium]
MTKQTANERKLKPLHQMKNAGRREKESSTRPKPGLSDRKPRFSADAKKWSIFIGLSLIFSVLLFPSILTPTKTYNLGDVADRDMKASREFLVENSELTQKNREEAVRAVLPVYDFDPMATDVIPRVREAFAAGRTYLADSLKTAWTSTSPEEAQKNYLEMKNAFRERFFEILDIPDNETLFQTLVMSDFSFRAESVIIRLLRDVFKRGVVGNQAMLMSHRGRGIALQNIQDGKEETVSDLDRFYDLNTAVSFVQDEGRTLTQNLWPEKLVQATLALCETLIKPNLTFNKRETALRKEAAGKSVKPFFFKVKKGEIFVREGERITPEQLVKLNAQYKYLKQKKMLGRVPAMAVLMAFLLVSMYQLGLRKSRSYDSEIRDLLLNAVMLLVIFFVVIAFNFVAIETARGFHFFSSRALLYAIPVAGGAMLICIFHGIVTAASFSLVASVLACAVVDGRVEFFTYFFVSSLLAATWVRRYSDRGVFVEAGLKVGLCNMILAFAIEGLYGAFFNVESVIACCSAFIGGVLVGVIATGLMPLIEMSFGYTTDIKLMELANLDQPLLRELMVQAPGTYHHCVIVSSMVEASARAIGANPLLAKVAAYYHDIGKIKKPLYFIENQAGKANRHEKLAPSMSALILIAHVKDGVELARQAKLGREIRAIIEQHHGTSLISFFYEKAKERSEKKGDKSLQVKEEDFRYRGPRPQTREAGLVMLADVIEAASKTLVDPTSARIQGMVQKIMNKVFSDGQLDECELTLKDLHAIAKSFNQTLSGIFHHRVEYPEPVAKVASARPQEGAGNGKNGQKRKIENGNSDQNGLSGAKSGRTENKAESEESLRRLGLS